MVYAINLVSRLILLLVAAYKSKKESSGGWLIITASFLLAAFSTEELLLKPLGLNLLQPAAFVLDMVNTSLQGVLLILAAAHLAPTSPERRMRISAISLLAGMVAYLWIVITNASPMDGSFTIKTLGPLMIYAVGYIYMGLTLYRHVVSRSSWQVLFPLGMVLLGLLNATYPVTATWEWFVPYGFLLGTIFRGIMAVGALNFIVWPKISIKPAGNVEIPRGVFMYPSITTASRAIGRLEEIPDLVLVTRRGLDSIKTTVHRDSLVFWITRVTEGELSQSPMVYAIAPTKIGILTDLIAGALNRGYRVVMVEAVEYLIIENGFDNVLKFLLNLKDRVILSGGTMILVVDPGALERHQLKILEREFNMG
ncbi:hypothetical protein CL1_0292 [Thermococcus cleftensis]|uniref:DUF835 domain-containing protein n=1 Tax=Thermococcus cleftensis (strain DSM 27260 / KACC 17922 / CL1) TaxID=163003 RepID=I3ZS19_THECF|nr:DUF835 domain-containing protein [Thermococcus cleftensis]AFL94503.1 hypothetical protein CL1_0292 [Thermococcus cleftensis]